MKKITLAITAIALAGIIIVSCKKNSSAPDCTAMATAISNAITAYSADQSSENCVKLKTAYQDYLNSSCIPESERASTQAALDALNEFCN